MPSNDALDLTTLQNLVDLDDGEFGLVAEMRDIFRDDTPHRLVDIRKALAAQDAEALSRAAHALKGGAGAMGARALHAQAAELEALARGGSLAGVEDVWQVLEQEINRLQPSLQTLAGKFFPESGVTGAEAVSHA